MPTSLTKLFFLTAAALTLSAPGLHAQTVTSQITGTYPTFSWPEWDQASSLNVSINTDPNPAFQHRPPHDSFRQWRNKEIGKNR